VYLGCRRGGVPPVFRSKIDQVYLGFGREECP